MSVWGIYTVSASDTSDSSSAAHSAAVLLIISSFDWSDAAFLAQLAASRRHRDFIASRLGHPIAKDAYPCKTAQRRKTIPPGLLLARNRARPQRSLPTPPLTAFDGRPPR